MLSAILNFMITGLSILMALVILRQHHPVKAAFTLILLAALTALRWALLGAGFFALILILIYLGAVLILFLFVVMTLSQKESLQNELQQYSSKSILGFFIGILALLGFASYYPVFLENHYVAHFALDTDIVLNALSINAEVLMQMVGLFLLLALVVSVLLVKRSSERSAL